MRSKRETRRLRYESLEDRRMLTVYTVTSNLNTGAGTLRDAVTQANSLAGADEIAFAPELSGKTILLTGSQLLISGDLKIDATSLPGGVTIDGNNKVRLLYFNSGVTAELHGLTLTRGDQSGQEGALVNYGTLTVDSCTFVENGETPIWNGGTVTVSRSFFRHNNGIHGSGLYNQGKATILDSTFAENGSNINFSVPVIESGQSSTVSITIERCTIGGDANPYDSDGQGTSLYDTSFFGTINQFTKRWVINNSVIMGNVDAPVQVKYSLLADVDPTFVAGVGNVLNANPQLGPLADNGGPTPTYSVLPGSPALNGGDPSFVVTAGQTDQRGGAYQRAAGRLDMGACEAQATPTSTPGDFNGDGRVDAADYVVWRANLGATVAPLTAGDATGDGIVDNADYRSWRGNFGFVSLGAKLVVNSLGDFNDGNINNGTLTLREAINFAKLVTWADSITFDPSLSGGVIQVGSSYPGGYYQIEKKLTIDARNLPGGITLNAGGRTIGLHINAFTVSTPNNFDVTLAGLTIIGGVGNFGGGGAINSLTTGKLTVIDCQLLNDNSGSSGQSSAIYAKGALDIVDTVIDGGVALGGTGITTTGAVYAAGDLTFTNSTIRNVGDATHKNVGIIGGGNITLTDSQITATTGGGVNAQHNVLLTRSHIENTGGPGVYAPQFLSGSGNALVGNVTLIDSTVSNNTSASGVALQQITAGSGIVAGGSVVLTRSRIENNRVTRSQAIYGGGISAYGHVTATDSFINGNNADEGGGIYSRGIDGLNPATAVFVTLVGTEVNNNESQSGGAAVDAQGSVSISTSTLSNNMLLNPFSALPGGIVMLDIGITGLTLSIADSTLSGNSGPLRQTTRITNAVTTANISITRSQVVDNTMNGLLASSVVDSTIARNAGTGIYGTGIDISGSTIKGNLAGGVSGSQVYIHDSTIQANMAAFGAAGVSATSSITVERSLIADNQTNFTFSSAGTQSSGGLWASNVVLVNSTVRGNSVSGILAQGGGINAKSLQSYGSTISGNSAIGDNARGGGVYVAGVGYLRQSTISGNRVEGASAQGGGIWAFGLDALQITVANNVSTGDLAEGGGVYTATVNRLVGGVVANNTATTGTQDLRATAVDPTSTQPGVAYSLVRDPNGSPLATGGGGVGNLLGIDPLLGPLADNGGLTQTHLPLAGSPLIDAGDPSLTVVSFGYYSGSTPITIPGIYDQRGTPYARVVDGGSGTPRIDIGAVEVQSLPSTGSLTGFAVSQSAPLTTEISPKSAPAAVDAAMTDTPADDLFLLIDAHSLIAARADTADVGRSTWDRSSSQADHIAIASFADFLPALPALSGSFAPRRRN